MHMWALIVTILLPLGILPHSKAATRCSGKCSGVGLNLIPLGDPQGVVGVSVCAIGHCAYQAKKEEGEQINVVLFVNEN